MKKRIELSDNEINRHVIGSLIIQQDVLDQILVISKVI